MRSKAARFVTLTFLLSAALGAMCQAAPQTSYTAMAPLDRYMMTDKAAEIALARSAAPASISANADVMVLTHDGYVTAAKGTNGFLCIVERGWGANSDDPVFWDPTVRGPICFNPAGAKTVVPIYLLKTHLVLAGKTAKEISAKTGEAFARKELPPLEPGAMCYMLSKQQSLGGSNGHWHPHLMFYGQGDVAKSWGANLDGSPVIGVDVPDDHMTVFMIVVGHWSDGTAMVM